MSRTKGAFTILPGRAQYYSTLYYNRQVIKGLLTFHTTVYIPFKYKSALIKWKKE